MLVRQAGNETWNDPYKPSNGWFPLFSEWTKAQFVNHPTGGFLSGAKAWVHSMSHSPRIRAHGLVFPPRQEAPTPAKADAELREETWQGLVPKLKARPVRRLLFFAVPKRVRWGNVDPRIHQPPFVSCSSGRCCFSWVKCSWNQTTFGGQNHSPMKLPR